MARSGRWAVVAVAVIFALSGCGTALNVGSPGWPPGVCGGKRVYGGVLNDVMLGAQSGQLILDPHDTPIQSGMFGVALMALALADVPLSAVADTLTLPITIPATLKRARTDQNGPETSSQGPSPISSRSSEGTLQEVTEESSLKK